MPRKEKNTARGRRTIRSPSLGSQSDQNRNRSRRRTRSPSSVPSDYEFYQLSDSPDEDWGHEADKSWPVKAVVSDAILVNRQIRYQVDWEGWQRPDGTSTTWTIGLPGANHLIDAWDAARVKDCRHKAKKTPSIDLSKLDTFMPHDFRTFENEVAYTEKREKWANDVAYLGDWLKRDEGSVGESGEPEVMQEEEPCASVLLGPSRKRKRTPESNEGSVLAGPSASSNRLSCSSSVAQGPLSQASPRSVLQNQWDRALSGTGAAKIVIVNEIDGEECPYLPPGFEYLENHCNYDVDVPDPRTEEKKAFLLGCECEDGCKNALECSCLEDSGCLDENGELAPAYNNRGLFLFNNQSEVVECNENCACKRKCNNAVAQKARTIPIEVFKTRNNGWGARCPVRISRGTVLGFYTGKVMKRKLLAALTPDEREYSFDIDIRDDEAGLEAYSVCAYHEGNWTRFVNHSCNPNAMVYSVVFDTAVSENMPYISLVATMDIPPKTEITIDYNPAAAREKEIKLGRRRKGKKRGRVVLKAEEEDLEMSDVEGRTKCICGSQSCRGFI